MLEGRTLSFGIPKKREVKVDPYEGKSLLIMQAVPEGKGQTYKFELTKLAVEQLGLARENNEDLKVVSFSFTDDEILIANTTSMKEALSDDSMYNVSMEGNFSNKKAHIYITNKLGLDPTQENIFAINLDDNPDFKVANIELLKKEITEEKTTEEYTFDKEEELVVDSSGSDIPEINAFEAGREVEG